MCIGCRLWQVLGEPGHKERDRSKSGPDHGNPGAAEPDLGKASPEADRHGCRAQPLHQPSFRQMRAFLSASAERLQVLVDARLRPSLAAAQALSLFTTVAVDSNPRRSAVLVPGGLESRSELGTHQRGKWPTEAYLLHEQNPPQRRYSVLVARETYPGACQCLPQTLPILLNIHDRGCYRTSTQDSLPKGKFLQQNLQMGCRTRAI
ncbi:hypothetical protein AAC387_Pa10g0364 [Persea americana]